MQKALLKISTLFLCGLLLYNSLGYFMVLSVMRISVRHQKWSQILSIPDHQLTTFSFKKNAANPGFKHINKREIMVDGKLYDIARKTDDGKTITFYCLHDKKEESLFAKTRQFHSMTQPVPAKNTARLIIEKIIKTAVINSSTDTFNTEYTQLHTFNYFSAYHGPDIAITVPPPQFFC
jgi:hypothetical protein